MKKMVVISTVCVILFSSLLLCACGNNEAERSAVSTVESSAASAKIDESSAEETKSGLTESIAELIEEQDFVGEVYVVQNGEVVFDSGTDLDDSDCDENTVFKIASNTKQFTAAGILILQQDGKLDVNDKLDQYLPECSFASKVTIHNSLSMRSGIPDYMGYTDEYGNHLALMEEQLGFRVSKDAEAEENVASIYDFLSQQELSFAPDSQFEYSNSNYFLLAKIIEKVSGQTYEEFLTERIFAPLSMDSTGFTDSYDIRNADIAKATQNDPNTEYLNYPGLSFGAGNIMSNAKDLSAWLEELDQHKILSKESADRMMKNDSADDDTMQYGYGLMIDEQNGFVWHTGLIPSFASMTLTSTDGNIRIILLTNEPMNDPTILGTKIFDLFDLE